MARFGKMSGRMAGGIAATALVLLSTVALLLTGIGPAAAIPAFMAVAALAGYRGASSRSVRLIEALTGEAIAGPPASRLAHGIALIEHRFRQTDQRVDQRHSVTGLPTRERLLRQMASDRTGTLGIVGISDFDRLCAFDPALGERFLLAIVDRLARMLPASRLVAHVDRASIALWFGPDIAADAACSQLDAIHYALGDVVVDGDREILPEVRVRHAMLDPAGIDGPALLARTLATLTVKTVSATATASLDPVDLARQRYTLEQDLRQAIARGELEMRYQPLIDAGEGRVCGAESLIRWFHPTRGQVSPAQFVPVMEAMGLAHDIGLWTLNTALREAAGWRRQGLPDVRVAVNVSGQQLDRDDMPALVARTLARHSLGPDALEIELTESIAMGDGAKASTLFTALRDTGVRIAIDDFGTGYSSFSTLRSLAFDKIKIDREFVTSVETRRDSQAICQSIVALGRGLGIRVLAEGVETQAEYQWLRRHGCTHFQGYYFSAPLAGDDFVAFARDGARLARLLSTDPQTIRERITERLTA